MSKDMKLGCRYWIYNIMVKSGHNVETFAKAIGVTQSCVNYWLIGDTVPSRKNMVKIAKFDK